MQLKRAQRTDFWVCPTIFGRPPNFQYVVREVDSKSQLICLWLALQLGRGCKFYLKFCTEKQLSVRAV